MNLAEFWTVIWIMDIWHEFFFISGSTNFSQTNKPLLGSSTTRCWEMVLGGHWQTLCWCHLTWFVQNSAPISPIQSGYYRTLIASPSPSKPFPNIQGLGKWRISFAPPVGKQNSCKPWENPQYKATQPLIVRSFFDLGIEPFQFQLIQLYLWHIPHCVGKRMVTWQNSRKWSAWSTRWEGQSFQVEMPPKKNMAGCWDFEKVKVHPKTRLERER